MERFRILPSTEVGWYVVNEVEAWAGLAAGVAFHDSFVAWLGELELDATSLSAKCAEIEWGDTKPAPELKTLLGWEAGPVKQVQWPALRAFLPYLWDLSFGRRNRIDHIRHTAMWEEEGIPPLVAAPPTEDGPPWQYTTGVDMPWMGAPDRGARCCCPHDRMLSYCLSCWFYDGTDVFGGPGLFADAPGRAVEFIAAFAALQLGHIPFRDEQFASRVAGSRSLKTTTAVFRLLQVEPETLVTVLRNKGWVDYCSYPPVTRKTGAETMLGRAKFTRRGPRPLFDRPASSAAWRSATHALDHPDQWELLKEAMADAIPRSATAE